MDFITKAGVALRGTCCFELGPITFNQRAANETSEENVSVLDTRKRLNTEEQNLMRFIYNKLHLEHFLSLLLNFIEQQKE